MKTVFKIALMSIALVAVMVLAMYAARMRESGEGAGVQVISLRARLFKMNKQVEDLREEASLLTEKLSSYSNRLSSTSASFDEEKKTHEPLRRQIETMLAESIRQKARLDRVNKEVRTRRAETAKIKKELAALQKTHQNLVSDNQSLAVSNKELTARAEALQKKIDALAASRDDQMNASLKALREESATLKNQLTERDRKIRELEKKLEAQGNAAPATP